MLPREDVRSWCVLQTSREPANPRTRDPGVAAAAEDADKEAREGVVRKHYYILLNT